MNTIVKPSKKKPTSTSDTTSTSSTASARAAPRVPASPTAGTAPVTSSSTGSAPTPPSTNAQPPGTFITSVANGNNKGTKVKLQTSYAALQAGLTSYYQPGDPFPLVGGTETRDELLAQFQSFIDAAEVTKAALTAYRAAVQKERTVALQVSPLRRGVRSIVEAKFGLDGVQLIDFGFTPRKPAVKSLETKTAAAAKTAATRKARGTKGAVQREAIKGNVAGVVVTPVTATLSIEGGAAPAQGTPAPAVAPTPPAAPAAK